MASQFPNGITPEIIVRRGRPTTTTKAVAAFFTKQHQHVTQRVESLDCSEQFLTSNFSLVPYEHNGNTYKMYEMTKNGFVFLVMGFTGKRAAAFKEAYIAEFDRMEAELASARLPGSLADLAGSAATANLSKLVDKLERIIHEGEFIPGGSRAVKYAIPPNRKHAKTIINDFLSIDDSSPLYSLLTLLERDGHDVKSVSQEVDAIRMHMTALMRAMGDINTHGQYISHVANKF
jgi:Rha family phage regulatory protein